MIKRPLSTVLSCALMVMPVSAFAASNVLFIMDSSNSMWGQLDGVAKIEIAKTAMSELIPDVPSETGLGLMAYGHRTEADCADVELLRPVGPNANAEIVEHINTLVPRGKTPLAASLVESADAFAGIEGAKNVVLISDGVETCGGAPCDAAARLVEEGVDVRVHVVGFDISPEERAKLECIAANGNGFYFDAKNRTGFSEAIGEALIVVAQNETANDASEEPPAPEPEPVRTSVWADDFDGFDLSDDWTVKNPNPDNYITEGGELLILTSSVSNFDNPEGQNVFLRTDDLPRGDWDIEVTFRGEMQTGADALQLGLYTDEQNYLATTFQSFTGYCAKVGVRFSKVSRGERTEFETMAEDQCGGNNGAMFVAAVSEYGALVTLSKRGRSYYSSFTIGGINDAEGEQLVWTSPQLTSLRPPGKFAISAFKADPAAAGELLIFIDKIEVISVE